jgi:uncharacterized protein
MNTRFAVFLATVAAILGLAAFYVGSRLIAWSAWAGAHRELVWLTLVLVIGLQFLAPYLWRAFPKRVKPLALLFWLSYTALGILTCLFFYTLAIDLLSGLLAVLGIDAVAGFELAAVATLLLVTLVVGIAQVIIGARIYQVDIPLANLPAGFEGFKIVQLSDLHLGPTIGRRYAERCVAKANALKADLAVLTGDFVDGSVAQLQHALEPMARLTAKQGTLFITGNHEYYCGVEDWLAEFRRLGVRVLLNEHVVIRQNDAELVVAGVTDISAPQTLPGHVSDPAKSIAGAPAQTTKILLAHHPASYKDAAQAGFQLQISGHTHGGQLFPFNLVVALTQRYYKGLYRFEDMWIYVNRGTGYWGPPLRFGVPAEITLLRLKRA